MTAGLPLAFVTEVAQFCICVLAGFVAAWLFGLVQLPLSRSLAEPENAIAKPAFRHGGGCGSDSVKLRVPQELVSQITRWLPVKDVAALSTTSVRFQRQFWQASEVWIQLAIDRRLLSWSSTTQPFCTEMRAVEAREAFRRSLFRLAGYRLRALAGGGGCSSSAAGSSRGTCSWNYAEVLAEAAHMMNGLMPRDGPAAIEDLCVVAEMSLQGHDSADDASAAAAECFLQAARLRVDIFDEDQLERLEVACEGAIHFDKLMETTMREFYEGLPQVQAELQGFYPSDYRPEADPFLEATGKSLTAEYEAMHESEYEVSIRE